LYNNCTIISYTADACLITREIQENSWQGNTLLGVV